MKRNTWVLLLAMVCAPALADWEGGISFIQLDDDLTGVSPSAVGLSVGHRFSQEGTTLSLIPTFRIAIGVGDDNVDFAGIPVNIKVNHLWSLSLRGEVDFNDSVYVWMQTAYTTLDADASAGGFSVSDSDGEFGFGAGIGFDLQEKTSVELSFESYDGTDAFVVGVRQRF